MEGARSLVLEDASSVIAGLSRATLRTIRSLPTTPPAVAVAHHPLGIPLRNRPDARTRGAVVVLPLVDSGLLGQSGTTAILLLVGLAAIAILALLVASAAHRIKHSQRPDSVDDEELFTTTPLPVPKEEMARMRARQPHGAYRQPTLPRWVQVGSIIVALGMTWYVAPSPSRSAGEASASRPPGSSGRRIWPVRR